MSPPTICTAPDDIPRHPDAPDSIANESPELRHCVVTSSFTLIEKHQCVLTAKSRTSSNQEKICDHRKSNHATTSMAQPIHHPRSKTARKIWSDKMFAKPDVEGAAQVANHDYISAIPASTESLAASEQLSPSATDEDTTVNKKAATDYREASIPLTKPISPAPLPPSFPRADLREDNVVVTPANAKLVSSGTDVENVPVGVEMATTFVTVNSQGPALSNGDKGAPHETIEGSGTSTIVAQWSMTRPASAPAEETVLQPIPVPVQSPVGMPDNKPKKALPGKENDNAAPSESVSAAPARRSQRILKRKRDENEDSV